MNLTPTQINDLIDKADREIQQAKMDGAEMSSAFQMLDVARILLFQKNVVPHRHLPHHRSN